MSERIEQFRTTAVAFAMNIERLWCELVAITNECIDDFNAGSLEPHEQQFLLDSMRMFEQCTSDSVSTMQQTRTRFEKEAERERRRFVTSVIRTIGKL